MFAKISEYFGIFQSPNRSSLLESEQDGPREDKVLNLARFGAILGPILALENGNQRGVISKEVAQEAGENRRNNNHEETTVGTTGGRQA